MKKHLSLLCLFTGMILTSFAQLTEGKVSYSIKQSSENPKRPVDPMMAEGSKIEFYFAPGKLRSERSIGTVGTRVTIVDEKAGKILELIDGPSQKTAVEKAIDAQTDASIYEVELIDETKDMLGYSCKKAILTNEKSGAVITIWYTNDIQMPTKYDANYNGQLPGFPMILSSVWDGVTHETTVVSIENRKSTNQSST